MLAAWLGGCGTMQGTSSPPAPVIEISPQPITPAPIPEAPPKPAEPPVVVTPLPAPPAVLPQPVPPAVLPPPRPIERDSRTLLLQLLPPKIVDRNGWAADIHTAFAMLRIPATKENYCASIAVIEQESGFQADPVVPGLSRIVWKEIEKRRKKYLIPKAVLDLALQKNSPDGRSYKARINALKTEREMNTLFDDMISELPDGKRLLSDYNPIRTGGPMQVSVTFAEEHVRAKPYPYPRTSSLRDEVFSRRGGVYFGIAHLLDYPAPYSQHLYRFADFNAGHYTSRNAAFQQALSHLSHRKLALDGDLLRYENGAPGTQTSATEKVLYAMAKRLRLSQVEIQHDLKQEKSTGFTQTQLYQRVFALADQQAGRSLPRELLPQIRLTGPKIQRRLTTAWFAQRVDWRYHQCLAREPAN
jgi:hypothetical protein